MGWLQDDSELVAIRQRRMQELMAQRGGGGVSLWDLDGVEMMMRLVWVSCWLVDYYDDDFLHGKLFSYQQELSRRIWTLVARIGFYYLLVERVLKFCWTFVQVCSCALFFVAQHTAFKYVVFKQVAKSLELLVWTRFLGLCSRLGGGSGIFSWQSLLRFLLVLLEMEC
jgi:hypothetical protein